jgi:hypothetical protein
MQVAHQALASESGQLHAQMVKHDTIGIVLAFRQGVEISLLQTSFAIDTQIKDWKLAKKPTTRGVDDYLFGLSQAVPRPP